MTQIVQSSTPVYNYIKPLLLIYAWASVNTIAPYVYIKFCTPDNSLVNFLTSPFRIITPHCKAIRWIIDYTADSINTCLIIFCTWTMGYLISLSWRNSPNIKQ